MPELAYPRKETLTMTASDLSALVRAEPGRVIVCSVAPVLVAAAQLANAMYHDVSVVYLGLFALTLVAFAVLATQYHLATFRVDEAWSTALEETSTVDEAAD